ncbi:hypothetical protein [Rickettsia endosymbiont of Orchestes rusci]|uniref:hypothetical protein n=1 Tax=Rickettsia endosymbiont of Orchestes rusci TaxID=3066250 RepID=UPI00313E84FF
MSSILHVIPAGQCPRGTLNASLRATGGVVAWIIKARSMSFPRKRESRKIKLKM